MNEAQRDVGSLAIRSSARRRTSRSPPASAATLVRSRPAGSTSARTIDTSGSARHDRPLDPGLSGRWLRGAGARVAHRRTGDRAATVRPGQGAETRGAPAHGRPGGPDHRHQRGRWSRRTHGPAAPCPPRAEPRPTDGLPQAFGRFEAAAPGELWTGDALRGPKSPGARRSLCFIDDHSRALLGYRWGFEDTVRFEAALRNARHRGACPACISTTGMPGVQAASAGVCQPRDPPGALPTGKATGRGKSSGYSRRCASSSSSRSRPVFPPMSPSSTGCSVPGSRPSITAASTPRPARLRSSG